MRDTMLVYPILAALVFQELLAEEREVKFTLERNSYWVNVRATWPRSSCSQTDAEYQVSTFFKDELELIHFVKTPEIVLENQPYWKSFILEVKYLCGGQVQPDPIKTSFEIESGNLGPVRHFALDGTLANPSFRWEPNSLDVQKARYYEFDTDDRGKDSKRNVPDPNITLKSPLLPDTVISVIAFTMDPRTDDRFLSEVSSAVYPYEKKMHDVMITSLDAEQIPQTNIVRVSWNPVSYVKDPTYTVTWLRPDKFESTKNTTNSSIQMRVFGKHGSVQEISVYVREPGERGLQIQGSEAATTFVYNSLPAPQFNLLELGPNTATFDLLAAETNGTLDFEVNGVSNRESNVELRNLLHMKEYLIRARACFVGGFCGDEGYHTFTFIAPLDIRDVRLDVLSSSELRASWRAPLGRDGTTFAGYGLTLTEIKKNGLSFVNTYEVGSGETSYTFHYRGTDRLYTLAISAYEEKDGGKVPGHTSILSIVVPRVSDEVSAHPPKVTKVVPAITTVTLDLEDIMTKNVRLFLMEHSGRWNKTLTFETQGPTLKYDSLTDLIPYESYFGSLQACEDGDPTECGLPSHFFFQTLAGAPSAPTGLEATFVNKTCIEFRWEPPTNTGAPSLNHYELKLRRGKEFIVGKNVSADTTDSAFDQLQPGTAYTVEVTAVNFNAFDKWFFSEPASILVSTSSSAPLWILVVVITIGVISGTVFFLLSLKRRTPAPSERILNPETDL